jgi:tRNA threonylcarbamoyladenosine biosynthesis protein TsaB
MTAPLVLSVETATRGGSIFLSQGEVELAARVGDPQLSQSSSLLSDINACLEEARRSLAEVELFACAAGPGSFTGLRIGIATVKALAASLKQPCVGIPTLEAVAFAAGPSARTVALLPAGRGEVFAQMFSVSDERVVIELDEAAHLSPAKLLERYGEFAESMWAGIGAEQHRALLESFAAGKDKPISDTEAISNLRSESAKYNWRLAAPAPNLARHVTVLALQALQNGKLQSPDALSAIYVRPSDAELNAARC